MPDSTIPEQPTIDVDQLRSAYQVTRRDLLAERESDGHWVGCLSSSALSTATAVSALALVGRHTDDAARRETCRQLVGRAIDWLAWQQNEDGGWGDSDKSFSNISTTMLVRAAFRLAEAEEHHGERITRAEEYIQSQGGTAGLRRRYGRDKTFAVPILTNYALAGLVPWREVSALPFEAACLPHGLFRFLRLPVVSYAIPALVAVGQARFFHRKPRNPITLLLRKLSVPRSLRTLASMQPGSGGFLEAAPLTSFAVMSLAGTGRVDHPVVGQGLKFLVNSVREDGSWPIDTNLATWNTTLAVNALSAVSGRVGALDCVDWLLECQHDQPHPLSHAAPGGWGWTDRSGAVPDVDDTAGALLALSALHGSSSRDKQVVIESSATAGVRWLLDMQNSNGGWPTFCRGWGTLPFDRSGTDLTAHAMRALHVWRNVAGADRVEKAVRRGLDYLVRQQRGDGSWVALWFGNQHRQEDENPVYGTARVLLAFRDLANLDHPAAERGMAWLVANRCDDGGWGAPGDGPASVEETAAAVEALLGESGNPSLQQVLHEGLQWLIDAVHGQRYRETSPIGFYFARLWYHERLYPLSFTVAALGQAVRQLASYANGDRPDED